MINFGSGDSQIGQPAAPTTAFALSWPYQRSQKKMDRLWLLLWNRERRPSEGLIFPNCDASFIRIAFHVHGGQTSLVILMDIKVTILLLAAGSYRTTKAMTRIHFCNLQNAILDSTCWYISTLQCRCAFEFLNRNRRRGQRMGIIERL